MKQIIIIFIIIIVAVLAIGAFFFYYQPVKTSEPAANPQLNFSYAQVFGLESKADPESTTQSWEGNKLKIVANKTANLCAKKTGGYAINGNSITLTIAEELKSVCDGFGLFGFNFLVGPLEKQNYNVSVIFVSE